MFFDACRTDYDKRSEYAPLTGTRVLNEPTKGTINKNSKVSTIYASAAGTTAWSPELKVGTISVFSQALIEGLRAHGLKPDCNPEKCFVFLSLLEPFMETRMPEILRSYRSSESQEPHIRGDLVRKEVTELSSPQPQDWLPPSAPEPTLDLGGPSLPISGDAIGITIHGATPGRISDDEMKAYLDGARLYSFSTKTWLPDGSIQITNLRRDQETNIFEFDLRVLKAPKGQMYWFEVSNRLQTIGCALPVDVVEQTVFRVGANATRQPASITEAPVGLIRLSVTLSENSSVHLREAMQLWEGFDKGNLGLQPSFLQSPLPVLRSNIESSRISWLAATIAASILTRMAFWDMVGEWVKSLISLNAPTTDGAVLWTERCLQGEGGSAVEPLKYFMLLDSAPLPILSYTIGLALRQAEYFGSIKSLPDAFKAAIARIHRRLIGAVGTFRPGGLFGCFMGRVGQVSPETIAAPAMQDEFRLALSRSVLMPDVRIKRAHWRPYSEREVEEATVVDPYATFRALEKALQQDVETAQAGEAEMTAES